MSPPSKKIINYRIKKLLTYLFVRYLDPKHIPRYINTLRFNVDATSTIFYKKNHSTFNKNYKESNLEIF